MGQLKTYALAGILAVAAATTTRAADLPFPPPEMAPPPVEFGGGWYLRGDIGFSNQNVDRLSNVIGDGTTDTIQKGFDGAPFGGVGVGYKFNEWLRADVTGEYRARSNFHGFERYVDPTLPTGFGTDEYTASKSEWVGMVNAYLDLGTWHGFTPFIGAGVGFAHNTIHDFRDTNVVTAGVAFGRESSHTNFAWAVHAGVAYAVSPNFSLEFAYRYLNLGDAQSGDLITYPGISTVYNPMRFHDLDSHDFKVGFRWMLGGLAEPMGSPIIRKY
jgi:opacity protein-like surface antigen